MKQDALDRMRAGAPAAARRLPLTLVPAIPTALTGCQRAHYAAPT